MNERLIAAKLHGKCQFDQEQWAINTHFIIV